MELQTDPDRDPGTQPDPAPRRAAVWPRGRWTRRALLQSGLVGFGGLLLLPVPGRSRAQASPPADGAPSPSGTSPHSSGASAVSAVSSAPTIRASAELSPETLGLLESSEFVYISPLRSDGSESRCHGEVWYGWLDETVVIITSRSSWKARAVLDKGLDSARIWVGDHGRWKGWVWNNDRFRSAPSFEARTEIDRDASLLERLMQHYAKRYAHEFGGWESRMRSGFESGERVLLRYVPVAAAESSGDPSAEGSAEAETTATSRQLRS